MIVQSFRQGYLDHYTHVRSAVPKRRLLEFESKDGWEPLCKFLGKDVPAGPYPRVNDADATVKLLKKVSRQIENKQFFHNLPRLIPAHNQNTLVSSPSICPCWYLFFTVLIIHAETEWIMISILESSSNAVSLERTKRECS